MNDPLQRYKDVRKDADAPFDPPLYTVKTRRKLDWKQLMVKILINLARIACVAVFILVATKLINL